MSGIAILSRCEGRIYRYKVTVVIPVTKCEDTLGKCINSVLFGSYDTDKIQILAVDAGASDATREVCMGYAMYYANVEMSKVAMDSVAAAKNWGINHADAEYVLILEPDTFLDKFALQKAVALFEKNKEATDLVIFNEKASSEDSKHLAKSVHGSWLKKTAIYKMDETVYFPLAHSGLMFRRNTDVRFNAEVGSVAGRAFYIDMIQKKNTIGFVVNACYYAVDSKWNSLSEYGDTEDFRLTIQMYKRLFGKKDGISDFLQKTFFQDMMIRFYQEYYWPNVNPNQNAGGFYASMEALLKQIDRKVILNCPFLDRYQKAYWLGLVDAEKLEIKSEVREDDYGYAELLFDGQQVANLNTSKIFLRRIRIEDGKCHIVAYVKSPIFIYLHPEMFISVNGTKVPLELKSCTREYYYTKREKMGRYLGFEWSGEIGENLNLEFFTEIEGVPYKTDFWLDENKYAEFSKDNKKYIAHNYLVEYKPKGKLLITLLDETARKNAIKKEKKSEYDIVERCKKEYYPGYDGTVWLYQDSVFALNARAYKQFCNDIHIDDEVERYYISKEKPGELIDGGELFVTWGSEEHIALFFRAKKILTSDVTEQVLWPVEQPNARKQLRGKFNAEVVCLQKRESIVYAPWNLTKYSNTVDRIVTTSTVEKKKLLRKYDFAEEDIVCTGYELCREAQTEEKSNNRILYMLSERKYLQLKNEITETGLYQKVKSLLGNDELLGLLRDNGSCMDVILPESVRKDFVNNGWDNCSEYIQFPDKYEKADTYCAMVTDFCSEIYDFIYMRKPVLFFIPDAAEFRGGMFGFKNLSIPVDKLFGPWITDEKKLTEQLTQLIENKFTIKNYKKEYAPYKEISENVYMETYTALMEEKPEYEV